MKSWLHLTLGLLTLLVTALAQAGISASLDSDAIAPGESVQLTLIHDGRTKDEPDLSPLDKDFDVLGRQSSTSMQIINGDASSSTQLTLTLAPKHSGALTVPSITWGAERTEPLALSVTNNAGSQGNNQSNDPTQAGSQNVFLETEVDSKQPLVQAAVNVTVKLYVAERLYRANLDLPATGDVVVQKVGADQQGEAVRNGRTYQVVTRHYLVFPQHSGTIKLAGAVLDAQVAVRRRSDLDDPFSGVFGQSLLSGMTSTRPMRLHGDDITLDVQPRPAGFESGYWLPARKVTLEGEWSPTNGQARVGDPITLTLHLKAEGQTAEQLPDLSALLALPEGVKAYPDQAKLDNSVRGDAVVGSRSQSIALIADEAGRFSIPDLKVRWWDTKTGQARETTLAGKTLVILPAVGGSSTSAAPNPATSTGAGASGRQGAASGPPTEGASSATSAAGTSNAAGASGEAGRWRWIAFALGAMWLATLAAWLGSKWLGSKAKRASSPSATSRESVGSIANAAQARAAFQAACRKDDSLTARRALLAWARAVAPAAPPAGLNALAKQIDDPALAARIRDLDRACYAGEIWQGGAALAQALTELPIPKNAAPPGKERSVLAPLYP